MDAILRSCPTAGEIAAIERDFKFTFETDPGPLVCNVGGSEAGARLALINAFRCMKALTFSPAIPLIGSNVYDWLKAAGVRGVRVFDGPAASSAGSVDGVMNIRRDVLDNKARTWADGSPGRMLGIEGLIRLIVHETAHRSSGKDHDCSDDGYRFVESIEDGRPTIDVYAPSGGVAYTIRLDRTGSVTSMTTPDGKTVTDMKGRTADSSLDYGGAWAAQYLFGKALAKHPALTERQRAHAGYEADGLTKDGRLSCGVQSKTVSIPAPPDTRPVIKRKATVPTMSNNAPAAWRYAQTKGTPPETVGGFVKGFFTSASEIESMADSFTQRLTTFEQEVNANPQFQRKPGGKGMVYDDGGNKGGHDAFVNALSGVDYDWFGTTRDQPDLKEGAPGYKKGMAATIKDRWVSDGNDVDVIKLFDGRLDALKATYGSLGYKTVSVDPKKPDDDSFGVKALTSLIGKVTLVAAVGAGAYFGLKYLVPAVRTVI